MTFTMFRKASKQKPLQDRRVEKRRSFKGSSSFIKNLSLNDQSKLKIFAAAAQPVQGPPTPESPALTLFVGEEQRQFELAPELVNRSPVLQQAFEDQWRRSGQQCLSLPTENGAIFALVVQWLWHGDYLPYLKCDRYGKPLYLDDGSPVPPSTRHRSMRDVFLSPSILLPGARGPVLRDAAVFCVAEKYGFEKLKVLAWQKLSLVRNIDTTTVIHTARYVYDNTTDPGSRMRSTLLRLLIHKRKSFKTSMAMKEECEIGGTLLYDLFCVMADVMECGSSPGTPRTV